MNTVTRKTTPFILIGFVILASCKPTVKVEAPDKPITINMNIKIDHEIRVKVDKELEDLLTNKNELF